MKKLKQIILFVIFTSFGSFFSTAAVAECGGQTQCIGVGATSADALQAHHGGSNKTPIFAFGNENIGVTSAIQTVYVEAVTGPASTQVVLGSIFIDGADSVDYAIVGGSCSISNGPIHGGANCTIDVVFSPVTVGTKSATLHVPLNPPACGGCISERTVLLTGSAGQSDPVGNAAVGGAVSSQVVSARRFSKVQTSNIHRRLESLHHIKPSKNSSVSDSVAGENNQVEAKLAQFIVAALDLQSLNLAHVENVETSSGLAFWIDGSIGFGSKDATAQSNRLQYTSDGISIGLDGNIMPELTLGAGIGIASDITHIGSNGSRTKSDATSLFVYSSYLPTKNMFLDALIGYSKISFDLARYVSAVNSFTSGQRDGSQWFGSISSGYFYQDDALLLSPYLRLDFSSDQLDQYSESGAGQNALTYFKQSQQSNAVSLGLRVQSNHKTDFGSVLPRLKLEYGYHSEGDSSVSMTYVDPPAGTVYTQNMIGEKSSSFLLGIGSDFIYNSSNMKLGLDYQYSNQDGSQRDQVISFKLTQPLDGKVVLPTAYSKTTFENPIQVDFSIVSNDNINRAPDGFNEALSYQVQSISVSTRRIISTSLYTRLLMTGFLNAEISREYEDLNRIAGGLKAEYQYRTSSDFDAVTWGVFANFLYENFSSTLRGGSRQTVGISARQSVTDRVAVFAAFQNVNRSSESDVFDTNSNAIRVIADYSLGKSGSIYLGLQNRRGDIVISTSNVAYYSSITLASANDDAFANQALTAIRLDATTNILTLGYNWPLGPRDSIDFSFMNIQSEPEYGGTGYETNQYSAAYIMRF